MDITEKFLTASEYVDFHAENIREKAAELFTDKMSETEKTERAYLFVRDEIPHSFDCRATVITAKASDVLRHRTGICHAKANLLAALLRSQGIPTGFCFEHITLLKDDSMGYCVHAFNAVYLQGEWVKLDARGNENGVAATFSTRGAILAYPPRAQYDEYFWRGIYAQPQRATMEMLDKAQSLKDIMENIPDYLTETPDIEE